ncbi:hypothetical protein IEQ34_000327 [Dendrobium chrysotoxum]|uniref:Transcription factor interactor and regulator CCHC(Zn) family n=1 Tax=Dendrobium chrysotoxum TaxID=161865 RepID=A0AAV7HQX8_DENCH|nr:hypothetical protein IEQ34_000327 [Dendrobium chrysotoxum]
MRKKCSHCNLDGHNSRTCQNQGVRIFGKKLTPSDCFPSAIAARKKGSLFFLYVEAQEAGSSSTTVLSQVSQPAMQNNSSTDMEPVISDPPTNLNGCYPVFFPSKLYSYPTVYPGFLQPGFPYPMPCWPTYPAQAPVLQSHHEIVKPVAVRLKSSIDVEEIDDLPRLSL